MATIAAPKFKRSVEFCGMEGPVDGVAEGQTCHRLPMHSGDHRAFVNGNGVTPPKANRKPTAKKIVLRTVGGQKYRQSVAKSGVITLTPVEAPAADTQPTKSARKAPASKPATGQSRVQKVAANRKPAAKQPARKVRVIPEAKSRRRVASSTGR